MAALRLPAPPTATPRWASPPPSASASASARRLSSRRLAARRDKGQDDAEAPPVRTLLIDNYDSYTYNIFQELSVVNGGEPHTPSFSLTLKATLVSALISSCFSFLLVGVLRN